MLVLTRKIGQQVVVDGKIEVSIVEIKGNKVRLAFHAPDDVHIRRKELCFDKEDQQSMNPMAASAA